MKSLQKLRQEYGNIPLLEDQLHLNPTEQFLQWLTEASKAKLIEPNAMVLSTVSSSGHPSSRTVLLKGVDKRGFSFFTRYTSRKGEQLELHPYASLTFWWKEIYRQVNLEGSVKKLPRKESLDYFHKRPRGAQIAALASHQSEPLASRLELEEAFQRLTKKYRGKEIPCPKDWGGYILLPERFEFWQGRQNRLHDRFLYVKIDGEWIFSRLAP